MSTTNNPQEKKQSRSEVGHAKNIANLNLLIGYAGELGNQYNPSNNHLKIPALQALYSNAQTQHIEVQDRTGPYAMAVDARELVFKPVNKNLTGLRLVYKSTEGVTPEHLEGLMTHIRKVKGVRAPGAAKGPDSHSVSQMSYDQRTSNMQPLIAYLQNTSYFAPNESQYTVAYYTDKKAEMLAATQAVQDAYIPLNAARTSRNNILYLDPQNLVDTAQKAKEYLLGILQKGSPMYKAVSAIQFRKR